VQHLDEQTSGSKLSTPSFSDLEESTHQEEEFTFNGSPLPSTANNDQETYNFVTSPYHVNINENLDIANQKLKTEFEGCDHESSSDSSDMDIGNKDSSETELMSPSCSLSGIESISSEIMSKCDSDSSLTDFDDNTTSSSGTDQSLSSEDENEEMDVISEQVIVNMSEQESQALTILSCFLRNNLSASTCKDILYTMKCLFSNSEAVSILDFGHVLSYVDTTPVREIHYCVLCCHVFPDDKDVFRCSTANCEGLRYKGSLSTQRQKGRQPRQCFVMADTKKQLINLLQSPGESSSTETIVTFILDFTCTDHNDVQNKI